MTDDSFRLGVDFGTSHTVAVGQWADGRVRPLLFDGSPLLPSAVFAGGDGILVGRAAVHAARTAPECFEPHPKRCIDHDRVLLGPTADGPAGVPVTTLIGAVLRRVEREATRTAGRRPAHTVLTCPAEWGPVRRRTLYAAAAPVFGDVSLVAEPVAAATHFVTVAGADVPVGACLMVYDLGGGTFDATVVRRTGDGFDVLATVGLSDAGGCDIDSALMAHLGAVYAARDPAIWSRLTAPDTAADRRASLALWQDVRSGKELLSSAATVTVHVPLFDDDVPFGREQLEHLARPVLERTVQAARAALRTAGVEPAALAGLYLVGGASRTPLAATLLHQRLGVAPTLLEQPELAVAEGSLYAHPPAPVAAPPVAATPPLSAVPVTAASVAPAGASSVAPAGVPPAPPEPAPTRRHRRRRLAVGAGLVAALLVGAAAVAFAWPDSRDQGGRDKVGADAPASSGVPADHGTGTGTGDDGGDGDTDDDRTDTNGGATPDVTHSVDPCLVGVWRERRRSVAVVGRTYVGSGGVNRFWADGRFQGVWDGMILTDTEIASSSIRWDGSVSAKADAADGEMTLSAPDGDVTASLSAIPGVSEQMTLAPGPYRYTCSGDDATLKVTMGGERQEITLRRLSTDPDAD